MSILQLLNRFWWNLKEGQYSTSSNSNKVVFCGLIPVQRWPPWHLIGWYRIAFSPAAAERFDGTWYGVSSQRRKPISCLPDPSIKIDGFTGLWLAETFQILLYYAWTELRRKWTGSKNATYSTKFVFFRADPSSSDFIDFFSSIANGLWRKLQMKQVYAMSSTKCVFRSGLHVSLKKSILTSDWLTHFYFSSVTAERILTK